LFCGAVQASGLASLPLESCQLSSAAAHAAAAARCGRLAVPENRDEPGGKILRLHVAVIPALRLQPEPDPLFVLSGGPGQAASDFYLSVAPAFARVRRDRDIVLVDQRGVGRSNRLDCALPDSGELAHVDLGRLDAAVQSCLAALPSDPRFYSTSIAVRDLDEVRAALGYERVNVYGVSYGTRVAQHYMRRYPQRVRAAILDGVIPPDEALGPGIPLAAQRALDALFEGCAADGACAQRFPELPRRFAALRARLLREPLTLEIPDPLTARPVTISLGAAELAGAVRLLSYSDETASILPFLIHEAEAEGRPQALAAQYLMVSRTTQKLFAMGMHFAVVCSEDAPRWREDQELEQALERTYIGPVFMHAMRTVCAQWPRGPVDADFSEPLRTDIPVLLLSGGADPATPPEYAQRVLPGLQHATHLLLAGQGHGQIAVGCIPRLAAQFIELGSAAALDEDCAARVSPAPFLMSASGPAP